MTETQLKNRIGIFLILSHFSIIILTVALYFIGGFLFEEMTTIIALIIPMFSIYTTAIIKYIIANRENLKTKANLHVVTNEYAFIVFFIPSIFICFLVMIIILKSLNIGFNSFEQFKIMLVTSETAFGAYVGLVLSSMFEIETKRDKKTK